jgi:hypothetical protein
MEVREREREEMLCVDRWEADPVAQCSICREGVRGSDVNCFTSRPDNQEPKFELVWWSEKNSLQSSDEVSVVDWM